MEEIIHVIKEYAGTGWLLVLYLIALVYLLIREKDRRARMMLVYLPLAVIVVFLLPPVYRLYSALEQTDTYYRFLWLIPMSVTTIYAGLKAAVRLKGGLRYAGYAVLCAVIILGGSCVYNNENVLAAENRQHVPHEVIDICDYLLAENDGNQIKVAFPSNLVQFVRQYTTKIDMPYGRDMLVAQWDYWNEVYDVMERPEVICAKDLAKAIKDTYCNYVVLDPTHEIDGDLADYGLEKVGTVDGFPIYRNPDMYKDE